MDPISDMIIRLKNANRAGKMSVLVPYSNLKMAIAQLLGKEGFIGAPARRGRKVKKFIEVDLLYADTAPKITDVKRLSKPGRRVYYGVQDIHPVRRGFGRLILSTPKGILTDKEAKKEKVGGEALFSIW